MFRLTLLFLVGVLVFAQGSQTSFTIPLPIENEGYLRNRLEEISNLRHPAYGQWMTMEDVNGIAQPQSIPFPLISWIQTWEFSGLSCSLEGYSLVCSTKTHVNEILANLPQGFIFQAVRPTIPSFKSPRRKVADNHDYFVFPQTIWNLYGVPPEAHSPVSLAPVEFQDDSTYLNTDMVDFEKYTGLHITLPTPGHIVGPFANYSADVEASLDMDYVAGVAPNATLWYWTAEGWVLSAVEKMLNVSVLPQVMTWSYGWSENAQCDIVHCSNSTSHDFVRVANQRLMLLALRGTTVVVASGDAGSPGRTNENCDNTEFPLNAVFPGASPYVLSVGATTLVDVTPLDASSATYPPFCSTGPISEDVDFSKNNGQHYTCAGNGTQVMCSNGDGGCFWTAGGGFSNVSATPSYQRREVYDYLMDHNVSKPWGLFNGSGRGYPDLAAVGHSFFVVVNGGIMSVDGTSASTPTVGALIARLNAERVARGQPVLGYVNPALYLAAREAPGAFVSIDHGSNNCTESECCPYGYSARQGGWDPVTGNGYPNYPVLRDFLVG